MIPLFKVSMSATATGRVGKVLDSGYIGEGPVVKEFEAALRSIQPAPALATSSCTAAIELVLRHLNVGPGDEVITTPLTCIATNAPIVHLGARPMWADVSPITGLIDPKSVVRLVTPRTKAIIGVDWAGGRADYAALRKNGVPVIQDAAHGPVFRSSEATGDYICCSYGPIKHLTTGDGGSIGVRSGDAGTLERLRLLRWYGLDRESTADFRCTQNISRPGMKWHMNDISAAIGLANLPSLLPNVANHIANAWLLHQGIEHRLVSVAPWDQRSNYWVFPILVAEGYRDTLKDYLMGKGIMASQVHARNDLHSGYNYPSLQLKGVDLFDRCQLNIPCGWWVDEDEISYIISTINAWRP